jgi:hypothetical protein
MKKNYDVTPLTTHNLITAFRDSHKFMLSTFISEISYTVRIKLPYTINFGSK